MRLLIALLLLAGLCLLLWRYVKGRWRWFAAAVTGQSLISTISMADAQQMDSWGVVAGAGWLFLVAVLFAAILIVPAIALWPSPPNVRLLLSALLGLIWLLGQVTILVYPIWDRWGICLPPGRQYGRGQEVTCEMGPLLGPL